jgi:hypothetical protein
VKSYHATYIATRPKTYPATHQRWQQRLERFQRSCLTVAAFCGREGIFAASFYTWRRRLHHAIAPTAADNPRLVPLPASEPVVWACGSVCG